MYTQASKTNHIMKNQTLFFLLLCFLFTVSVYGQMIENGDTLYGNEWIEYDQEYLKLSVTSDGMYKVDYQELIDGGVFSGSQVPQGNNFQLYHLGQSIPLHVTTAGAMGASDYITFSGEKNRGEIDRYIYSEPDYQLNPRYSLFQDTAAYFLTWNNSVNSDQFVEVAFDNNNLPTAEDYCIYRSSIELHNAWAAGYIFTSSSLSIQSHYDVGEGWGGSFLATQNHTISANHLYASGPASTLKILTSSKLGNHDVNLSVNNVSYVTDTYNDFRMSNYNFPINSSDLNIGNNVLNISCTASSTDAVAVSTIDLDYPRSFDFENQNIFKFKLEADPNNKKYIEIDNFNHGGIAPILYDLTNKLHIYTALSGNTVRVVLPASANERNLVLVSSTAYKSIDKAEQRSFIDYAIDSELNYMIVTSSTFNNGNGSGDNYINDYANYRSSLQGGGYNVGVATVEQIYDQFCYGINQHELSIKNFTHSMIEETNIGHMFLIGHGLSVKNMRNNWYDDFHVPTFGLPYSDHIFATDHGSFTPKIAIGRLSARTHDHIRLYLDKVEEYESAGMVPQTIEDKAWMKRIVHLGGGDAGIQNFIRGDLNQMKDYAENGTFGADVYSFFKTSADVIQEAPTEQIEYLINNGTSLITFFGHSAPSTLDFDLDAPSSYNNAGKYPLIYTIGCNTGRINSIGTTMSEDWIFIEDKGAVAFIGASWETSLNPLSAYGKFFYENFATDNYGETLGNILLATINDFEFTSSSPTANLLKQVIQIHGDPAIKMNPHSGPDYLVDGASVTLEPTLINSQMDSFFVNITLTNIGAATQDSMNVTIDHELPNGNIVPAKSLFIKSPRFEENLRISVPLPEGDVVGFNKLIFTLDATDTIAELPAPTAEMNNRYNYSFYVLANDAFPIYPYEYSILNTPNPTLKASTANVFADEEKYYLEIDTTSNYNSPLKLETVINQKGGVIEWQPSITYLDNTVYYWRISIDSTQTTGFGFNWHESSFLYKESSPDGWNQSHFFQLKKDNKFNGLELPSSTREISFDASINELRIQNGAFPLIGEGDLTPVLNGGVLQAYKKCTPAGIDIAVLDSCTLEPWMNPAGGDYGSFNCKTYEFLTYPFKTNTVAEREKIINFLENVVPSNSYVVLFTTQRTTTDYEPELWAMDSVDNSYQKNIFQLLEEQGATKVRQLETKGSVPYFFIYRKDDPSFLAEHNYMTEVVAENDSSIIETSIFINSPLSEGNVQSTKIGPARAWQSLLWNMENFDAGIDKVKLKIYGVDLDQNETLLHQNISVFDTTLNHISAQSYPYLRLEFNAKDSISKTSPHLDYWRVLYDPVPEAALRPDWKLSFQSDTLQQGEELVLDIAVENISEVDMDSLLIHYTVFDQNNQTYLTETRMAPLTQGDTLNAHLSFNTRDINTAVNQLIIDVNPNNDQLEQHHFNNIGVKQFFITLDKKNPLLDVTFDGVHILDGDLVSAKPLINVILKDENQSLALNDTSLFRIKLLYPNETQPRELLISDEGVTFYPAEEGNLEKENKARIELRQFFQEDGIYELSIRAQDRTGNNSGDYDYKIRFEIINEAMVSNVLNYPNPFSTSTQFVFTLTGSEVPDFMKIQIMSVSGKVVREITNDELGPLHVGKNMTQYRWDGTDEFGDRLANGVYLYRVVTRETNGAEYKNYNTNTNQYFKNGFGKMVIMR